MNRIAPFRYNQSPARKISFSSKINPFEKFVLTRARMDNTLTQDVFTPSESKDELTECGFYDTSEPPKEKADLPNDFDTQIATSLSDIDSSKINLILATCPKQYMFLAKDLAKLDEKQILRIPSLIGKLNSFYDVVSVCQLDDKNYQRFSELQELKTPFCKCKRFFDLSDEEYQKALDLIKKEHLSQTVAACLSTLDDEKSDEILENCRSGRINYEDIESLTNLEDKDYKKFNSLILHNVTPAFAFECLNQDEEIFNRVFALINKGFSEYSAKAIINDDTKYNRFLELSNLGVQNSVITTALNYLDNDYEKFKELILKGYKSDVAIRLAKYSDFEIEKYDELVNKGISEHIAVQAAPLDEESSKYFDEFINQGIDEDVAYNACTYNDKNISQFKKYLSQGMSPYIANEIIATRSQNEPETIELIKRGLSVYQIRNLKEKEININYAKTLLKNGYETSDITYYLNGDEDRILKAVCEINSENNPTRDFFESDSYDEKIFEATKGKYQKQLFDMLKKDSIFYSTQSSIIKSGLSEEDILNSLKKLSKSTFKLAMDKPNQYLSDIDTKLTKTVNGKYPELKPIKKQQLQNMVVENFKEKIGEILRALKYLDVDTVNQMMDKRTELFNESLFEINQLTDKNYEILSKLIQSKPKNSDKDLSAKEKIQLCQLVRIYQIGKIDMSNLEKMAKEGVVDIPKIKNEIFNRILENAGIDKDEITLISKENLDFDKEYSYLLLDGEFLSEEQYESIVSMAKNSIHCIYMEDRKEQIETYKKQLQNEKNEQERETFKKAIDILTNYNDYTEEEILNTFIQYHQYYFKNGEGTDTTDLLHKIIYHSAKGDFQDFISDTSNPYGKANLNTKKDFKKNGLNYEKWINPDLDEVNFKAGGKNLKIGFWKRTPKKDLFMGNRTACCSAIGTGINGKATPIYLLNTAFNVINLFDENNELKGMARVFMGNIEGKNSLIVDCIEINDTWLKDFDEKDKEKIKKELYNYINAYCSKISENEEIQAYCYSTENNTFTAPKGVLQTMETVDFIGDTSSDSVYINCADFSWLNPKELADWSEIALCAIPKK